MLAVFVSCELYCLRNLRFSPSSNCLRDPCRALAACVSFLLADSDVMIRYARGIAKVTASADGFAPVTITIPVMPTPQGFNAYWCPYYTAL